MKIFKDNDSVNFVDENNVFVGFDMEATCCERFGWELFSDSESVMSCQDAPAPSEDHSEIASFDGYVFDKDYFVRDDNGYECGGEVHFKLTAPEKPDMFLTIWCDHNGYYAHGFEFRDGDKIIQADAL